MTIELLRYHSTGRIYVDTEKPGQEIEKIRCGGQNISDGNGGFLPFLTQNVTEINYGNNDGIEFASDRQILKQAGQVICESYKFFVQAFIGGSWVNQPHGAATRQFRSGQVFRDGGWIDDDTKCTGYLTFPDAHLSFGAQNPYNLAIGLEAGGSSKSMLGFRFRAPASGQVRFAIVLDGISKLPSQVDWEWINSPGILGREVRHLGIRVKDFVWRWTYAEAPFRDITFEPSTEYTDKYKVSIIIGPFDYTADEWLTVYPDTQGPVSSGDAASDLSGTFYDDLGGNDIGVGVYTNPLTSGIIFSGITASGTANDGCFIRGYDGLKDGAGSVVAQLRISSVDNPAAWGAGNLPSNAPLEAPAVAWSPTGTGTKDSPEIKTLIQPRFDDVGWTSGILAFVWEDNGSDNENAYYIGDESVNPPELTIVYTPGGGGGGGQYSPVPIIHHNNQMRL